MSTRFAVVAVVVVLASVLVPVQSEGFLSGNHGPVGHKGSSSEDFHQAMSVVMGSGAAARNQLAKVERTLAPMWRALPKNPQGMVEWRMVRYVAHRYFMQQYSLLVRGFEPMRQISSSDFGSPDILDKQAPASIGTALDGKRSSNGFSMHDVATMLATLEQLIVDGESSLLESVYTQLRMSPKQHLDHLHLSALMEVYMVHWMLDGDQDAISILLRNRTLIAEVLPKWNDVQSFVKGSVKSMELRHQRLPQPGNGQAALAGQFSFDNAHEVAGHFTRKFAGFWENECQTIKDSLVEMDKTNTGRVSLADFYGANSDGEWRFGESEAYLRELGALDESSAWRGKQVIISNYLLGPSNCIVSTAHYLVCCVNECETVLNELEDAFGAPVASPDAILSLVGNMSSLDDELPKIDASLKQQLSRIAETHDGMVPLHGRLFAQWLHYVFPLECPFPHKVGAHSLLTPSQYGDSFIASDDEISAIAATRNQNSSLGDDVEEAHWMSQWSEEEELIADYSLHLQAPWDRRHLATGGASIAMVMMIAALAASWSGSNRKAGDDRPLFGAAAHKAHYV